MKFVLLFITLSGNYTVFAQNETPLPDSIASKQINQIKARPVIADTLPAEKPSIRLYPNPAENKVEIKVTGFKLGNVDVLLLDNNGNVVRKDTRQLFTGSENIVFMFMQKPGIYTLMLKQKSITIKERLIIR